MSFASLNRSVRRLSVPTVLLSACVALALCPIIAGCDSGPLQERILGTVPSGSKVERFEASVDSRHAALVCSVTGGKRVAIDGWISQTYREVGRLTLADAGGSAFAALLLDGRAVVVRDGRAGKTYEATGQMLLTRDGRRLAYPGRKGSLWTLVLNGREAGWYEDVRWLAVDSSQARFVYAARLEGKWALIEDGAWGPRYDSVESPVFSADGRHLAYNVRLGGSAFVVRDGAEQRRYDAIAGPARFSRHGERLVYVAMRDGRMLVVTDTSEGPASDRLLGLETTPDLEHISYTVGKGDSSVVVIDGREGRPYKVIGRLLMASSGRTVYPAIRDGHALVVDDTTESRLFDNVDQPTFSSDGRRLAYAAVSGGLTGPVVDGTPGDLFEAVGNLQFSPDGTRFGYAALRAGTWRVVVDGVAGPPFEAIIPGVFFSPDSRHVVYGALRKGKKVLVVDGEETVPEYDGIRQVVFEPPSRVRFLALRADTILTISRRLN